MIHTLATSYSYTTQSSPAQTGANIASFLIVAVLVTVLVALAIVGLWKVFTKAGKPGWACIVPIYNGWVLAEIAGKPGWWGLYPLVAWIPFLGWIVSFVVSIILSIGVAKNFGKSTAFGVVGLWLFSFVGYLMLGFGSAQYQGVATAASGAPQAPQPFNPVPPSPGSTPPAPPTAGSADGPKPPAPTPPVSG